VQRNAYGRQVNSFIGPADTSLPGGPLEAVFIRAPKIASVGRDVEVLAREGQDPVLVRQGKIMAATFHPELSADTRVHKAFLDLIQSSNGKRKR
jgi:5'-phosphate synthase pdxT subunit